MDKCFFYLFACFRKMNYFSFIRAQENALVVCKPDCFLWLAPHVFLEKDWELLQQFNMLTINAALWIWL